jgi:hypothetical protein
VRAPDVEDTRTPSAVTAPAPEPPPAVAAAAGPAAAGPAVALAWAQTAARTAELLAYGPQSVAALEDTLAELVRGARTDWPGLRGALAEATEKFSPGERRLDLPAATPLRQLHALVDVLVWLPAPGQPRGAHATLSRLLDHLDLPLDRPAGMDRCALRTPADILTLRLAEIAARIGAPSPVELVSTPTDAGGWIAPEALVGRVAAAEDAGWQPWPIDFDQALLRLPAAADPATTRAAHSLVSPAGRRLAGWLRGGRPTLPAVPGPAGFPDPLPRAGSLAHLPAAPGGPGTPVTLVHLLRRGWHAPGPLADGSCWPVCWPGLLPGHADLVAVAGSWHPRHPDAHGGYCEPLPLTRISRDYRQSSGLRPGYGVTAALARGVISRSAAERADAAEALTLLAGSGLLDGVQLAAALTRFAAHPERQVLRVAAPIFRQALDAQPRTVAATRAAAAIGTTILHWLPALLPPAVPLPLPYTSRLLEIADCALGTLRERGQKPPATPALTANLLVSLTQRSGRSPVSTAARRLLITSR